MSKDNEICKRSEEDRRRKIEEEKTFVQTGSSPAQSSHQSLFYNLISPHTIRRLAKRKTVGGIKYGTVQWRQGINDIEYVADRFNHMVEHLMLLMEHGNKNDDNIGAMLWALDALSEVERLCPDVFNKVIGTCNLYGASATEYHNQEKIRRGKNGTN